MVGLQVVGAETGAALRAIARTARRLLDGRPVPEMDELELIAAFGFFNIVGGWFVAADAAMVLALQKSTDSGRPLEPIDLERLTSIESRCAGYARSRR